MMASYFLSRTLVPTMMHFLLPAEIGLYQSESESKREERENWVWRWHMKFEHQFEKMRHHYKGALEWCLHNPAITLILFGLLVALSLPITFFIGEDFFPYVDSGQMRLHVNPPQGMRLEDLRAVLRRRRTRDPPHHSGRRNKVDPRQHRPAQCEASISPSATTPPSRTPDGEILIALTPRQARYHQIHAPAARESAAEVSRRHVLLHAGQHHQSDPGLRPARAHRRAGGRTRQGQLRTHAAVDEAYCGDSRRGRRAYPPAGLLPDHAGQRRSNQGPADRPDAAGRGAIDAHLAQRHRPDLAQRVAKSGERRQLPDQSRRRPTIASTQFPRWAGRRSHQPQATSRSCSAISPPSAAISRPSSSITTTFSRSSDVYADVDRRDLGGVASEIRKVIDDEKKGLPHRHVHRAARRGQDHVRLVPAPRASASSSLSRLVYLLMAVNFQSWLDPMIILMAIPGAFSGILWMLFITQTTSTCRRWMGAIMTIGVATANSILMVVFANDERTAGKNQMEAALNAGYTRLRPVIMTALAMIIGMFPMALALGEGGEQMRRSARAVIGGLLFATVGTLFIVPGHLLAAQKESAGGLRSADRHRIRARSRGQSPPREQAVRRPDTAGATRLMPPYEEHPGQKRLEAHEPDEAHALSDGREDMGEALRRSQRSRRHQARAQLRGDQLQREEASPPGERGCRRAIQKAGVAQGPLLGDCRHGRADADRADRRHDSAPHNKKKDRQAPADQQKNAKPEIDVMRVERLQNSEGLVVPGTTTPLEESAVYARASGYLKRRFVDIGDHVHKGQLLAIIDAPDLDAQVDQARHQVDQAESQLEQQKAQLALDKVTNDRYQALVARGRPACAPAGRSTADQLQRAGRQRRLRRAQRRSLQGQPAARHRAAELRACDRSPSTAS